MKITSLIIASVFVSQALTGCNAFHTGHSHESVTGLEKGKDTCGRRYFEGFMGTPFDDLKTRDDFSVEYGEMDDGSGVWTRKNRTFYLRVFDPRTIPEGEDRVVLANFSAMRLNVFLTDDGMIKSLGCG